MITLHTGITGPDQTNGTSSVLYNVGSDIDGGIYTTVPLFKFNLTPYAGATITGAATVSLFYSGSANFNAVTGSIHPVLVNWTETGTTWNNFGASPGPNAGTDYGTELQTVTYLPGSTLTFDIPGSVIQGWIDAPVTNNGLMLIMNGRDITFSSKESGGTAPTLTFIPEPSAALLAALTLPLALFRRKRA